MLHQKTDKWRGRQTPGSTASTASSGSTESTGSTGSTGSGPTRGAAQRGRSGENVDRLVSEARASSRPTALAAFLLGVLIAVAAAFLIAQNRETVSIDWFMFGGDAPLWLVIGLAFVAGLLAGLLLEAAARHTIHRRAERREVINRVARG